MTFFPLILLCSSLSFSAFFSIRFSTWQTLLSLQNSILSTVLKEVLLADPLQPILTSQHLQAIDRRLEKVLHEVEKCIQANGLKTVIFEAKSHNTEDL